MRIETSTKLGAVGSQAGVTADPANTRSIDGSGNNPLWHMRGAAGTPLGRLADARYEDGVAKPVEGRPNPRTVSNLLSTTYGSQPEPRGLSNLLWVFGQLLDHDLDLSPEGTESHPIPVPPGDTYFAPNATGAATIATHRSVFLPFTGTSPLNPRQQQNVVTTWIDGSMI